MIAETGKELTDPRWWLQCQGSDVSQCRVPSQLQRLWKTLQEHHTLHSNTDG